MDGRGAAGRSRSTRMCAEAGLVRSYASRRLIDEPRASLELSPSSPTRQPHSQDAEAAAHRAWAAETAESTPTHKHALARAEPAQHLLTATSTRSSSICYYCNHYTCPATFGPITHPLILHPPVTARVVVLRAAGGVRAIILHGPAPRQGTAIAPSVWPYRPCSTGSRTLCSTRKPPCVTRITWQGTRTARFHNRQIAASLPRRHSQRCGLRALVHENVRWLGRCGV